MLEMSIKGYLKITHSDYFLNKHRAVGAISGQKCREGCDGPRGGCLWRSSGFKTVVGNKSRAVKAGAKGHKTTWHSPFSGKGSVRELPAIVGCPICVPVWLRCKLFKI